MTINASEFRQLFPGIASHCDDKGINALLEALTSHEFSAGQQVIHEGDATDALYLVQQGTLSTSIEGNGQVIDLGNVSAGDSFGKESLLEPGPASRTVKAETDAVLLSLSYEAFRALEQQHLTMTGNLLRMISNEMIELCRGVDRVLFERFSGMKAGSEAARPHAGIKEWAVNVYRKLHGGEEHV